MARIPRFLCVACQNRTAARFDKCPRCEAWNTCERLKLVTVDDAGRALPTLDQISAHDPVRVEISPAWDRALGGGLATGTQLAMWSMPGSGKTTEALRFCSKLRGLFVESEFRDLRKLRMLADKASIDSSAITPVYLDRARDAVDMIRASSYALAVIDSLNGLCGASAPRRDLRETLESLRDAAESSHTTLVIILQVTRAGTANAPTWVEHMVDTTISLSKNRIYIRKNRYGEAGAFSRDVTRPPRARERLAVVK